MYDKQAWGLAVLKAIGDMSQKEFSKRSGVSRGILSIMVTGKYNHTPTMDTIEKIASSSRTVSKSELIKASGRSINDDALLGALSEKIGCVLNSHGVKLDDETINNLVDVIDAIFAISKKM